MPTGDELPPKAGHSSLGHRLDPPAPPSAAELLPHIQPLQTHRDGGGQGHQQRGGTPRAGTRPPLPHLPCPRCSPFLGSAGGAEGAKQPPSLQAAAPSIRASVSPSLLHTHRPPGQQRRLPHTRTWLGEPPALRAGSCSPHRSLAALARQGRAWQRVGAGRGWCCQSHLAPTRRAPSCHRVSPTPALELGAAADWGVPQPCTPAGSARAGTPPAWESSQPLPGSHTAPRTQNHPGTSPGEPWWDGTPKPVLEGRGVRLPPPSLQFPSWLILAPGKC